MDTSMTNSIGSQLEQHWVSVVDERGRERMEARWFTPQMASAMASAAHAA